MSRRHMVQDNNCNIFRYACRALLEKEQKNQIRDGNELGIIKTDKT